MTNAPLTKRQREIYDFCADYIGTHGYAPTLAEIGQRFQLSSLATVHKHLESLAGKGWIIRRWNRSRSIEFTRRLEGCCPLCGQAVPAEVAV
jgi:repressor LexA